MYKKIWSYLKVTIVITMMFLANTVYVAFGPMLLREVEAKENSADKSSTFCPPQLSNDFYFNSQDKNEGIPESLQNFWDFGSFDRDSGFNGIKDYGDFVVADGDSVELVIGVNVEAYESLVRAISASQGKVVNTVSIKDEVIAIVADMPFNVVSSFREEVQTKNLARYVEPNMKFEAQFVPNDPLWSLQWGPQKIGANWAWDTKVGNHSVLVAVIDTGIDYNHPDLVANYVSLGYDWVNGDGDPIDDNGHGTHCAGIIAAVLNNALGIAGVANVSIMAEKGLNATGYGDEDDLANAIIDAVDEGADILSNSWGDIGDSTLIHDAIKYAYANGVLVLAAAGNSATNIKYYPAAYDEVVAVTATNSYDVPASFTNFGDWVEVAAPGVNIFSTMPTYHVTLNDPPHNKAPNYDYLSGTSMACPHAAGVAALIWSQFPNATRDWVRAQLRYTAEDLGDSGFDKYYGYGRINAKNAVEQVPPDHDLLIFDWERLPYIKLRELAIFNATVLNFGVTDETDVEVDLLVNDNPIDSTSIALLPKGASTTVELTWTPSTGGTYYVTYYVVPVSGETIIQNNLITETVTVIAPPPESNWVLLATDPDEGMGTNLKSIYGQMYSNIIFFKVEYYRLWATINDIDTSVFIDADQNASTGLPDGTYPDQYAGIGADYLIVVGWEATEMWKWDPIASNWDLANPISLAYLDVPEDSDVFVVGVFLADVETNGGIDCAVSDIPSNYDWMPDTGHFTWTVIQYITASITPSAGSPGSKVSVSGVKATANGTVSIYWDDILMGNTAANNIGDFAYLLTVPENATVGVHEITAVDTATGKTSSSIFKVFLIVLNPTRGSIGTKVTVKGSGFSPENKTTVTFNDMLMGYVKVDSSGNFTFTFNVPLSKAETQVIKALDAEANYAFATFTVVDVTPLDVTVDVGAIHFLGEVAEFYAQVSFKGVAVNATSLNAILYKPNGATETVSAQLIATGLYKIPYTIVGNQTDTYTLVVTVSYVSDTIGSNGTSFKCFLVSNTLALMNNRIIEIKNGLALVQNDLGFVKLNLTAMNVTLQNIFLKPITINGTTVTFQTLIGVMNGTITRIDNNIATIVTPIGDIETDISSLKGTQEAWIIPQYAIIIIALIAAASSTLTLFSVRRRKTVEVK